MHSFTDFTFAVTFTYALAEYFQKSISPFSHINSKCKLK